jgi:IS1 family transposase
MGLVELVVASFKSRWLLSPAQSAPRLCGPIIDQQRIRTGGNPQKKRPSIALGRCDSMPEPLWLYLRFCGILPVSRPVRRSRTRWTTCPHTVLSQSHPETFQVVVEKVDAAAMDAMWSFAAHTRQQRWLWHARDHQSSPIVASVLERHQGPVFLQWKTRGAPWCISRLYTDVWGAYQRHLPATQYAIGKDNTQKIE